METLIAILVSASVAWFMVHFIEKKFGINEEPIDEKL
jgi:molybdenum cofactor biosynthesis enzyme